MPAVAEGLPCEAGISGTWAQVAGELDESGWVGMGADDGMG